MTDPYDNATGLRFPRTIEADLLTISHKGKEADNIAGVGGGPFLIENAGEFEVKGVFAYAIDAPIKGEKKDEPNLILRFEVEDMTIAHLGALNRELTDDELKQLENVDILMLPVGGKSVMNAKAASTVISQVEPRVVIPMTYAIPNLKESYEALDVFLKEMGATPKETANKFKVSRKDLPEEEMLIMVLER